MILSYMCYCKFYFHFGEPSTPSIFFVYVFCKIYRNSFGSIVIWWTIDIIKKLIERYIHRGAVRSHMVFVWGKKYLMTSGWNLCTKNIYSNVSSIKLYTCIIFQTCFSIISWLQMFFDFILNMNVLNACYCLKWSVSLTAQRQVEKSSSTQYVALQNSDARIDHFKIKPHCNGELYLIRIGNNVSKMVQVGFDLYKEVKS
jgi:hypothetical protein